MIHTVFIMQERTTIQTRNKYIIYIYIYIPGNAFIILRAKEPLLYELQIIDSRKQSTNSNIPFFLPTITNYSSITMAVAVAVDLPVVEDPALSIPSRMCEA